LIGIFDSGSGGLTVMRALEQALPTESFIYLGDHGNAPYGNRSPAEIYDLTLKGLEHLFALGCSLVVIACNTAAATGLRQLQQTWLPAFHPSRRVLGVIVPVIEEITGIPWVADAPVLSRNPGEPSLHIAIFATKHTVQTGAYPTEIGKRAPAARVSQQACPELARMIEDGAPEEAIRKAVRRYTAELLDAAQDTPDICVLGCTHYPLVEHIFVEALPKGVRLLSQAEVTAESLKKYLARHPEFQSSGKVRRRYLTSGSAHQVSALASRFYGRPVRFQALLADRRGMASRV
jgi:glutamate racemase